MVGGWQVVAYASRTVEEFRPNPSPITHDPSPIMTSVFIISAPSGSGKSTLVRRLLGSVPGLMFSVSYTTRPPRGHEVEGGNYHFISRPDFEKRIALGEFLEHAEVFGN